MIRDIFKLSACLLTGGLLLAGCGKKQADDVAEKSYEDYKKEAQQEITAENAEQELDQIEQEMNTGTE